MMQDFLKARQHLAVVVDEYDSVAGIVTIEDVLEENGEKPGTRPNPRVRPKSTC
ncbi:MAG: hypothetical protein R3B96_12955 [Pirellulaceae bacterium]